MSDLGEPAAIPLGTRFPAAHQFLRMRLLDAIFPIAPSVICWAHQVEPERWDVRVRWPEIGFDAANRFTSAELRAVFGRWSTWARNQALDIADLLPV